MEKAKNPKAEFNRSPFFYVGDKFKLLPQLKENFPKNIDRFIEPFCGGGSVFLNTNANQYLLNDIDANMVSLHKFLIKCSKNQENFWTQVNEIINHYGLSASYFGKTVSKELRTEFPKTYFAKFNKEAYTNLRADYNADKSNMMLLYSATLPMDSFEEEINKKGNNEKSVGKEMQEKQGKIKERQELIAGQKEFYRMRGLCQHCGGTYKTKFLFFKSDTCSRCGKKKDY